MLPNSKWNHIKGIFCDVISKIYQFTKQVTIVLNLGEFKGLLILFNFYGNYMSVSTMLHVIVTNL